MLIINILVHLHVEMFSSVHYFYSKVHCCSS